MTHTAAISSWLQTSRLPVNVKVIVEGEEESGSPHFADLLSARRDRLACDVVVVSDTSVFDRETPSICTGMRGLVSAQIALALVLLVGAGLLIRTLSRLGDVSLGFQPDGVLTLRVSGTWGEKNDIAQVERRFARTLDALRALPGVEAAAISAGMPGTGEDYPIEFSIVGRPNTDAGQKTFADSAFVATAEGISRCRSRKSRTPGTSADPISGNSISR